MKRIKRVFSNPSQVLHLWANQSQSDARSRNVFYNGKVCYSYGFHYELGRLIEYKGKTIAMINTRGYSVTTSGHISSARSAANHLITLDWPLANGVEFSIEHVLPALIDEQDKLIDKLFNHFSRRSFWKDHKFDKRSSYGEYADIKAFNKKCYELGHANLAIEINDEYIKLFNDHIKKCLAREAELQTPEAIAKRESKREQREANEVKNLELRIQQWKSGGALTQKMKDIQPAKLRIHGDEVQTTMGASVPLDHALRLLRMIDKGIAKSGERVGHFSFSNFDGETVRIGCHRIAISEARETLANAKPRLEIVS